MELLILALFGLILISSAVCVSNQGRTSTFQKETVRDSPMYLEFIRIEGNKAIFVSHDLKKMYFAKLDAYDLTHTEMKHSYVLHYTPEGFGRHKISHNGKVYKLYEI